MPYELFEQKKERAGYPPKICITKTGTINVNGACIREYFGDFDRVYLLFNNEKKLIGLRPTDDESKNTHIIHKYKRASMINAMSFLKQYKIFHRESKDYEPRWDEKEKLVEINLDEPIKSLKEYKKKCNEEVFI